MSKYRLVSCHCYDFLPRWDICNKEDNKSCGKNPFRITGWGKRTINYFSKGCLFTVQMAIWYWMSQWSIKCMWGVARGCAVFVVLLASKAVLCILLVMCHHDNWVSFCVCFSPCLWSMFQLQLGNLDSKRDWGHARDYVEVEK